MKNGSKRCESLGDRKSRWSVMVENYVFLDAGGKIN